MKKLLLCLVGMMSLFSLKSFAQEAYKGQLISMPNPPEGNPPLPGMILGLESEGVRYVLVRNGHWIWDASVEIDGETYEAGDQVEIVGRCAQKQDNNGEIYMELTIECIKKQNLSVPDAKQLKSRVLYNPKAQVLTVKTAALQGKWTLRVLDAQGRLVYTQTESEEHEIAVKSWSKGVYIYNLIQNGTVSESGKWVKSF